MNSVHVKSDKTQYAYIAALLLGLASFFYFFGYLRAIGMGHVYTMPSGDLAQHVAGAYAYLDGAWRLPLFYTDRINYPEGANIIFTDSAPFAGLIAKIFYTITGVRWNYLGTWFFILWILQAVSGAYLLKQMGVRDWIILTCGAILALTFPAFLARHGHLALSSHFLLLFALGLYFRDVKQGVSNASRLSWFILLTVALFTHAYLFVMCFALSAVAVATSAIHRKGKTFSSILFMASSLVCMILFAVVGGYLDPATSGAVGGFDLYSSNILAPFWPTYSYYFGGGFPVTNGGQYEGFAYLGFAGILTLFAASAILLIGKRMQLFKRHVMLIAVLVGFTGYSISTSAWFGETKIFAIPAPDFAPFTVFRASGRFSWLMVYFLLFASFATIATFLLKRSAAAAIVVCVTLTGIQAIEALPWVGIVARGYTSTTERHNLEAKIRKATFVNISPRWFCADGKQGKVVSEVAVLAARNNIPVNTVYLAHQSKGACETAGVTSGEIKILVPSENAVAPKECSQVDDVFVCTAN